MQVRLSSEIQQPYPHLTAGGHCGAPAGLPTTAALPRHCRSITPCSSDGVIVRPTIDRWSFTDRRLASHEFRCPMGDLQSEHAAPSLASVANIGNNDVTTAFPPVLLASVQPRLACTRATSTPRDTSRRCEHVFTPWNANFKAFESTSLLVNNLRLATYRCEQMRTRTMARPNSRGRTRRVEAVRGACMMRPILPSTCCRPTQRTWASRAGLHWLGPCRQL